MIRYLPCPNEVENCALDQTKGEEKVRKSVHFFQDLLYRFSPCGILRALGVLGFVIWVSNRTPCCIGFQIGRRAFWAVDIFEVLLYLIFCVTLIFLTIYPSSLSLLCRVYEGIIRKGDFIVNVNTGKKIKVRFR